MLDGLRNSSLGAAISDLADGADALREVIAEQSSVLAEIDQRQLATLNGLRTSFPPQKTFQLRMWCEWPYTSKRRICKRSSGSPTDDRGDNRPLNIILARGARRCPHVVAACCRSGVPAAI
jgi:hypothetical protein